MRTGPDVIHEAESNVETSSISVAHIVAVLGQYKRAIVTSVVAIGLLYLLIAVGLYIFTPTVITTRLPFRLEFEGAERGEYPNGLKFSTAEIVSPTILTTVFTNDGLAQYISFPAFKSSVFVQESSKLVQRLEAEYRGRLADPRLSPVDRERIERDFDLKVGSLRHSDFALVMTGESIVRRLPADLREKTLNDILSRWADLADREKGALKYRRAMLSSNIVPPSMMQNEEGIIALDVLRSRVNRLLANIDQLGTVPGAETVRIGPEKISLAEIRVALEDVRRFTIEPLIIRIYRHGLVSDQRLVASYFDTQLLVSERELEEARLRVTTLQNALSTYMGRPVAPSEAARPDTARTAGSGAGESVTPQLTDTFIDRIVRLVSDAQDSAYRQTLLDRANEEAFGRLLPTEKEVAYYSDVTKQMSSSRVEPPANPAARAAEIRAVDQTKMAAFNDVVRSVGQFSEVYRVLSRNLDPDTQLYTRTGPVTTFSVRAISVARLALIGLALLLMSIPIILAACLLHARVREEEEVIAEAQ